MQLKDLLNNMSKNNITHVICHASSAVANSEICKILNMETEDVYISDMDVDVKSLRQNEILMNLEIYIRDICDNRMLIELH